jgi:methionyl-tRNA formyltransferase
VAVLQRLAGSEHRPALVVTPPDRPRGRGRRVESPPVATVARELDLELIQAESVNDPDVVERIRVEAPEVAVVCAFGQLIREPLLSELRMLNVHPSLIPRWRGAAPIERAIMAGDTETGMTIMEVTEGLDSGPVALQERTPIAPDDDYGSLAARLARLGGSMVLSALDLLAAGRLRFVDQDDSLATYAEKIRPEERRLDPGRAAVDLARTVRALTPHIGAYLELEAGARLGVRAVTPLDEGPGAGELAARDGTLVLGCAAGGLRLDVVQPPGGRPMPADAYLRGHGAPQLAR